MHHSARVSSARRRSRSARRLPASALGLGPVAVACSGMDGAMPSAPSDKSLALAARDEPKGEVIRASPRVSRRAGWRSSRA
jgi:hypothetical protein